MSKNILTLALVVLLAGTVTVNNFEDASAKSGLKRQSLNSKPHNNRNPETPEITDQLHSPEPSILFSESSPLVGAASKPKTLSFANWRRECGFGMLAMQTGLAGLVAGGSALAMLANKATDPDQEKKRIEKQAGGGLLASFGGALLLSTVPACAYSMASKPKWHAENSTAAAK